MAKIFEWDARKGSFVEGVSKTVMTPTAMTFNRTDKGFAALFNGSTSELNSNISGVIGTGDRTIEIWFRTKTSGTNSVALISDGQFLIRGSTSNNLLISNSGSTGGSGHVVTLANKIKLNTWHHLIVVRQSNGTITPYLDLANVFSSSFGSLTPVAGTNLTFGLVQTTRKHDGEISLVRVYDNLLSEKERENTYRDFLQSQITEKPVRGFELVKPTDLSYLKDTGLVAAYNMIPNGNTLVDISGNNNNATIFDVVNTKRGLSFNGVGSTVITSMTANTDFAGGYTILARIKLRSFGGSNGGRIVDKSESTSGTNGFYLALTSPALDIAYNDGAVSVRTTSNIIQLGQEQTIAMTMASNKIILYHNGIAAGTASRAHNYTTPAPLTIGNRAGATDRGFDGEIIDIRIYSRVLTLQELKNYHNSFVKPVILEDWSGSAVGDTI